MSNVRFSVTPSRAVSDLRITHSQFRTLAALGLFGDKDGWCYPKQKTLGDMLGKSQQAISKDIQALVDLGYVEVMPTFRDDGGRQYNLYRIRFDLPSIPDATPLTTPEVVTPTTPEVVTPTTPEVVALTPQLTPHTNERAPENSEQPAADKKQAYRDRLDQALAIGMTRGGMDVSQYPERTRGLVAAFCKQFNFKPPRSGKGKSEYAQWIMDAEDFIAACDEIDPVSVLTRIRAEFVEYMSTHGGLAPFRVLSIRSLVKSARQAAGELRGQTDHAEMPTTFYY